MEKVTHGLNGRREEKINGGVLGFPFFLLGSRVVINDENWEYCEAGQIGGTKGKR